MCVGDDSPIVLTTEAVKEVRSLVSIKNSVFVPPYGLNCWTNANPMHNELTLHAVGRRYRGSSRIKQGVHEIDTHCI